MRRPADAGTRGRLDPEHRDATAQALVLFTDLTIEITSLSAEIMGGGGLSNTDVRVLLAIRARPTCTPTEVAERLELKPSAVSRSLRALRGRGVVEIRKNPNDLRSSGLTLSKLGRRHLRLVVQQWARSFSEVSVEIEDLILDRTASADHQGGQPREDLFDALDQLIAAGAVYVTAVSPVCDAYAITCDSDRFALTLIAFAQVTRPRDVAQRLKLTTSGVSSVIDRLERSGLVTRQSRAGEDRRQTVLSVTPLGRRAATKLLIPLDTHFDLLAHALLALIRATGD